LSYVDASVTVLYLFQTCAFSQEGPKLFISPLTAYHQVFLSCPTCLVPSTFIVTLLEPISTNTHTNCTECHKKLRFYQKNHKTPSQRSQHCRYELKARAEYRIAKLDHLKSVNKPCTNTVMHRNISSNNSLRLCHNAKHTGCSDEPDTMHTALHITNKLL